MFSSTFLGYLSFYNFFTLELSWLFICRTGKSARLTIREEGRDGEEILHTKEDVINGTNSILNLDPEHSKLFVGGFPSSFKIQDEVKESSFDGEMEDLVVGDTPVSLWNFVDGANNRNGSRER